MELLILGGAPRHDYGHLSNKVAHCGPASPFRCARYMGWREISQVSQNRLAGKRKWMVNGAIPCPVPPRTRAQRWRAHKRSGASSNRDGGVKTARPICSVVILHTSIVLRRCWNRPDAIPSRTIRPLVASEDRRLRGGDPAGAVACLSGRRR